MNTIQTYRGYRYLVGRPWRVRIGGTFYVDPHIYTVKVWPPGVNTDFSMDYSTYIYYFQTRKYVESNIKRIINKLIKENRQ